MTLLKSHSEASRQSCVSRSESSHWHPECFLMFQIILFSHSFSSFVLTMLGMLFPPCTYIIESISLLYGIELHSAGFFSLLWHVVSPTPHTHYPLTPVLSFFSFPFPPHLCPRLPSRAQCIATTSKNPSPTGPGRIPCFLLEIACIFMHLCCEYSLHFINRVVSGRSLCTS